MSHHALDARRLLCPMPVIRTQNCIKGLSSGDILEVTCTDPSGNVTHCEDLVALEPDDEEVMVEH